MSPEDDDRSLLPSFATLDVLEDTDEIGEVSRDFLVDRALICIAMWDSAIA